MAVVPFKRPGKPAGKRRGRPAKAGKALSNAGALQHLRVLQSARGGAPIEVASIAELAGMLRWKYPRTHKAVGRWRKNGQAKVEELDSGHLSIFVHPDRGALERGRGTGVSKSKAPRQTRRRNPGQMPPEYARENLDKRMDKTAAADIDNTSTAATSTTSTKPGKSPSASEGYFFSKPAEEQAAKPGSEPAFPSENTTAEAPKIPPALPYGAAPWSAALEGQKLGIFSRSKKASETPPQPTEKGKQPAQVPVAQFGYGYPATVRYPQAPHVERPSVDVVYATHVPQPERAKGGGGGKGNDAPGFDAVDAFRQASGWERLLILVAGGISGTAAYMSVSGFVVMVPGAPTATMVICYLIETAKFVGAGVLSAGWKSYSWMSRMVFGGLLIVAALINASGVYGFLISNHAGPAASRTAAYTERDAGEGAKLEVAQGRLADIERRLAQIDGAVEGAAKRGRANTAVNARREQQKDRTTLASERDRVAQEVANLKAGRSGMAARHQVDEAAALPVRASAALFEDFGWLKPGTDPEKLWRWIAFMVLLTADPLALTAMFLVNSRFRRQRREA